MPRPPKYTYLKDQVFYDGSKESCIVPRELITELQQLANRWSDFRCLQERPLGTRANYIQKRLELHVPTLSFVLRSPNHRKPKPRRYLFIYQFIRHQREIHQWLVDHFPVSTPDALDEQITRTLEKLYRNHLFWNPFPSKLSKNEVWSYIDQRDTRYRVCVRAALPGDYLPLRITPISDIFQNLQFLRALPKEAIQRGFANYDPL